MTLEKNNGAAAAEQVYEETRTEETVFEKATGTAQVDREELRRNVREVCRRLGEGARDLVDAIGERVPNRTLKLLIRIGIVAAVFSVAGSWVGRLAITAGVAYLLFGDEINANSDR